MTDLEKFTKLVEEFGIFDNLREGHEPLTRINDRNGNTEVNFWAGDGPKIDGYPYFCSSWQFTPDGKFVSVGAWE